jgi:hypothetical protein
VVEDLETLLWVQELHLAKGDQEVREWENLDLILDKVQIKYQVCQRLFNLLVLVIRVEMELQTLEQELVEVEQELEEHLLVDLVQMVHKVEQVKMHHLYLEQHHNLIMDLLDRLHFLEEVEPVLLNKEDLVIEDWAE